jgi:hypothetical protein
MSGVTDATLRVKLEKEFSPEYCTVEDTSDGCGAKFKVYSFMQGSLLV